jgi:hypothetical protein
LSQSLAYSSFLNVPFQEVPVLLNFFVRCEFYGKESRLRQMSGEHEERAVYESLAKVGAEAAK